MPRLRDLLMYVGIAVGIYGSIVAFAAYQVRTNQSPGLPLKWLGFAAITALVFGDAIRVNRSSQRRARFWLLLGGLLSLQCAVGITLLLSVARVPTLVWLLFLPLDYVAVGTCLKRLLPQGDESMRVRSNR
jgi:hypothetical protein